MVYLYKTFRLKVNREFDWASIKILIDFQSNLKLKIDQNLDWLSTTTKYGTCTDTYVRATYYRTALKIESNRIHLRFEKNKKQGTLLILAVKYTYIHTYVQYIIHLMYIHVFIHMHTFNVSMKSHKWIMINFSKKLKTV